MNAKEKQIEVINSYLKPVLKSLGFKTSGQNWWKDKGEFFDFINLQNYSYNSKDRVEFCFNIGVCLKATMKDKSKSKPSYYDKGITLRENFYLLPDREEHDFRGKVGYLITDKTDLVNFILEFRYDIEFKILPHLNDLISLEDCLKKFRSTVFFGEIFENLIKENNLVE